jgi:DNA-directed RNA polymerase alpha subunit
MRIKKKNLNEIEDLVTSYCQRKGICKSGGRIKVFLSLDKSPLHVVAEVKVDPEILTKNSRELWLHDNKDDLLYGVRVGNILNNIGAPSMYDLVHNSRSFMRLLRNFGKKSFNRLEEWMTEYGLSFEMEIPPDVKTEFFKLSGMVGEPEDYHKLTD